MEDLRWRICDGGSAMEDLRWRICDGGSGLEINAENARRPFRKGEAVELTVKDLWSTYNRGLCHGA
ncbi:hypothetical protein BBD41_09160 [Paenibacillus ihbetae]|uniref:Uncharacterized protein n=1 Tax=Paenibacillus ihbetae TaxID=1870820 RepID=A0A1B2DYG2_9BACL|nr:hypothetical protein BBD41_09160 [Paenibacillus ihbetae]